MKTRFYIVGSLLILILALSVISWRKAVTMPLPIISAPQNDSPAQSPLRRADEGPVPRRSASPASTTATPALGKIDPKAAAIMAEWSTENAKAMDTYGKVVDQYGNPVAGVKVEEGVGLYISPTRSGGERHNTETDSDGNFHFTGIHGAWAGYDFKKEGYIYNLKLASSTRLENYSPDSSHPIIFTMWKLKGAEPMIHKKIEAGLLCDGSSMTLDLLTGHRVESGGDLTLSLTRNPVNIDRSKPFDWSLALRVTQGGLVEITDPYPNEAPAEGYEETIKKTMHAGPPNFTGNKFDQSYYIKSRDGQVYGRIKVHITADYQPPPARLEIEVFANPSGSRNLEYNPSKQAAFP